MNEGRDQSKSERTTETHNTHLAGSQNAVGPLLAIPFLSYLSCQSLGVIVVVFCAARLSQSPSSPPFVFRSESTTTTDFSTYSTQPVIRNEHNRCCPTLAKTILILSFGQIEEFFFFTQL